MNETISQCLHSDVRERFCSRCGIYCEKTMGVYGIKKVILERQNLFSSQIIDVLRENQFDLSKNKDYFYMKQQIMDGFTQIFHICNQIHANYHTKILSLYMFWHSNYLNKNIERKDILLSIFIALKFQQSYMFLRNRFAIKQKLLTPLLQSGQIYQHELIYQEMERIEKVNFKLKIVSFVDFLQFYVNSGVMFTNQMKKSSDYNKIINYIDFQTLKYIETGLFFTEPNQEYLALKILYDARRKCGGIDEIWNWHIQYITKTKKNMIDQLIRQKHNLVCLKQINISFNHHQLNNQNSLTQRQKKPNPVKNYRIFGQNLHIR